MSALASDRGLNLQATELCLGLPGGKKKMVGDHHVVVDQAVAPKASGSKRGYQETVDLKLNLEPVNEEGGHGHGVHLNHDLNGGGVVANGNEAVNSSKDKALLSPAKPPAKAQVVGWPPVRSYRKNMMSQKNSSSSPGEGDHKGISSSNSSGTSIVNGGAAFVKVCMDGAPYLRKVDLKMFKSYQELSDSLAKMFSSFTIGNYNGAQGMIDFMNEGKLMDLLNSSEYVPTYEDKDGDWMLVSDVPWEMFVDSCKRLRIMKGSEAIGLAPRAMQKCKSRT